MEPMSRRGFLVVVGAGAASLALGSNRGGTEMAQVKQRPPALKPETVKEFVGAAHGDLEKTKAMLAVEPGLLNAVWDWGGGDFEAAIGGAGHMGRKDIAEFLIGQGARMDLFVATMLGRLDLVKATLAAYPNLKDSKGPHGITLTRHAEMGGEGAKEVLEFLKSVGAG